MATAEFRFYEELNDFLAPGLRRRSFRHGCARAATVKNAIESLGVPHTEVELILVNGAPVDFARRVADGDRIAVYPRFEAFDVTPLLRLRERPLRETRFIADAHLGGLARLLRMLGFDTLYARDLGDDAILRLALDERRVILTRDKALLKRREVSHGCFLHARKPAEQLCEIVARLQLESGLAPLRRCPHCNAALAPADKAQLRGALPASVAEIYHEFFRCPDCARVYWQGEHWHGIAALLAAGPPPPGGVRPTSAASGASGSVPR